ncbi:hypothetical protein [Paraburkholderia sp. MM5482-R1]|uniref:hypothetical protein n=1 Tax=unclassified Paraburkholderia TaxID=2615204 RepID=UPI003D215280
MTNQRKNIGYLLRFADAQHRLVLPKSRPGLAFLKIVNQLKKLALVTAFSSAALSTALSVHAEGSQVVDIKKARQAVTRETRSNRVAVNWKGSKVATGEMAGIGQVTVMSFGVEPTDGGNWWADSFEVFWATGHSNQIGTKGIQQMSFKDGLLYVKSLELGDDDAQCCPATIELTAYRADNGKLVAVSSKVVRQQHS